MKEFWKTGVLLLAAVSLGFYVLTLDEAEDLDDERPVLVDEDADSFDRMEIIRGGQSVVLEREAGKDSWLMSSPKKDGVDSGEIESLLGTLEGLRAERELEWPAALSSYGLDPPAFVVKATGSKGVRVEFRVGGQDITKEYRYVALDKSLYIVSSYHLDKYEKDSNDYRNKDVLAFDRDQIQKITYDGMGQKAELSKKDGRWVLDQPNNIWRLAHSAVDGLITKFENLRVKSFVENGTDDLKAYGINLGQKTASLYTQEGKVYRVAFGKEVPQKDEVYLLASKSQGIVTVTNTWPENIFMNILDLRDKDVFDISYSKIESVVLDDGGRKIRFSRDPKPKEMDSGEWYSARFRIIEPKGVTLGARQALAVAEELAYLNVVDFLHEQQPLPKETGLSQPVIDIKFSITPSEGSDQGEESWVQLGSDGGKDKVIYARASSLAPQEVVLMTPSLRMACKSLFEILYPTE